MEKIDDNDKNWAGTKVKLKNVGLNVKEKKDDYYDYFYRTVLFECLQ